MIVLRHVRTLHPKLPQPALNLRPRYNIAPTTAIDVVRLAEGRPELVPICWGLIPGWWKKTARACGPRPWPKSLCFDRRSSVVVNVILGFVLSAIVFASHWQSLVR
ncbi:MAG TPA: SOS response-associated peptidase family protein [Methylocella sp.]|nr:SOS response-associated peptidase family protein [Methylocella sp.]